MAEHRQLYDVLGVRPDAAGADIRRAYKRLARQYHPDVNPNDQQAAERFKEISAAYEVLSDPTKRASYDEFGEASLHTGFDPEKARAFNQWARSRRAGGDPFAGMPMDFELGDLFGDLFGGRARTARTARGPMRGDDIVATVEIDLAQAISGTEIRVRVPIHEACSVCSGNGAQPGTAARTCQDCGGTGQQRASRGPLRLMTPCATCGGRGTFSTPCQACNGLGVVGADDEVTVRIPPGADEGSRMRVAGRGGAGLGGGPRGDLVLLMRVRPHAHFRRQGLDLMLTLPITLDEAYNGATVKVPTPTGPVDMRIPPGSQSGARLRLRNKGVPRGGKRGDLYVDLEIRLPRADNQRLSAALREATALYDTPVREGIRL